MDRLNFTQMVNKKVLGQPESKFFDLTKINSDDYYENINYSDKIKKAHERLNLEGKINDIVSHVHEQLRERQYSPKRLKPNSPAKKFPEKLKLKTENIENQKLSLPRLKVLHSEKQQKNVHNSTMTTSNIISYEDHRRMLKAVKRQKELENLLKEQQDIQKDRRSLTQDIFAIRHCLDDLQHRLNYSLKELDNKKTYCERHGFRHGRKCKQILERDDDVIKEEINV
ncbi:uncharacterized protein ACRADG_004867 isoform 2-T2 [Cochliomyia hominivorax]